MCGFIRPDAGQVLIDGRSRDLRPHQLAGLGIARTLQGVGLFERLSAIENVMTGANCRATAGFWSALLGLPRSEPGRAQAAAGGQARHWTGWGRREAADARPGELPYGMRKRVALARALAARPKLLLLDEPASGLSESELAELGELIRELAAETSLVIVEHHMDLMMSVCDSLVVLDFGKVISRGTRRRYRPIPR